ncbi:MAG: glycosyltransferase family 4 protein [Dehalococcoidales bacterium]|nr:glycosyltransferase family 4 protein [Dehalococcoidales bacterium]
MKICYIADGSSIHTQRWINYFAARGHETHLIYWKTRPGYHQNVDIHLLKRLAPAIWPVTRYFSFLQWIFRVRRLLKEIKPDVLDSHFVIDNGLLAACSGFHPYVVTAWGSDVLIFPRRNFIWRMVAGYVLKHADKIICDSDVVKTGLLSLGARPEEITKVYNGIDTGQFSPKKSDEALKNKLDIKGSPMVISIRHLRPLYNVEMLVRAVPLVLKQAPRARFIIGGDGAQRGYLEDLAAELGAAQNVSFIGYLPHDDLPGYLASSDIYVTTSRSDSSSQSLQEAMACELAPVVTDLPANREWITDGENGFVVPQDDPRALAEKIVYLIENSETRAKFGKINRKLIEDNSEYEKEMGKVEKLYESMMSA